MSSSIQLKNPHGNIVRCERFDLGYVKERDVWSSVFKIDEGKIAVQLEMEIANSLIGACNLTRGEQETEVLRKHGYEIVAF